MEGSDGRLEIISGEAVVALLTIFTNYETFTDVLVRQHHE